MKKCDGKRMKLGKQIASIKGKVRREKQFNKRVLLSGELMRLRKELDRFCGLG